MVLWRFTLHATTSRCSRYCASTKEKRKFGLHGLVSVSSLSKLNSSSYLLPGPQSPITGDHKGLKIGFIRATDASQDATISTILDAIVGPSVCVCV